MRGAWLFVAVITAFAAATVSAEPPLRPEYRLRLSFANRAVVVTLRDHPATRSLLAQLPATLPFRDYLGLEKIATLPARLTAADDSPLDAGDFAYYAPWGNLAIFYTGTGRTGGGLIILGTIESGKEHLAAMNGDFTARLERIE